MIIRVANYQELQLIKKLAPKIAVEMTNGYLNGGDPQTAILQHSLPNSYYLVIVEDDVLKGWVSIGENMDPFTFSQTGFVNELYVFPQYRKKGLGEKLMKKALQNFKKNGYKKVQLNVFEGNTAKNLYNELGFSNVSTLMEKYL